jgi:hypothetical protein
MNANDQAKLDAICREGFKRLDALDEAMYERGFVTCKATWYKTKQAMGDDAPKPKKPNGPSPMTVNKPVPLGVL